MALDVLVENEPGQLLKGYSTDQLNELYDKVHELEGELSRQLDYGGEVQEVIGAKMDKQSMWFYVRWDDDECSFIPAQVLNRTSPEKVIQYYESILQFQPSPEIKDTIRGADRLLKNLGSSSIMDRQVKEEMRQNKAAPPPQPKQTNPPRQPHQQQHQPQPQQTQPPKAPTQNPFCTMNCTGCGILLQFPEGTKAIKCPVCNTVMAAQSSVRP